jgi:hypothetical protein
MNDVHAGEEPQTIWHAATPGARLALMMDGDGQFPYMAFSPGRTCHEEGGEQVGGEGGEGGEGGLLLSLRLPPLPLLPPLPPLAWLAWRKSLNWLEGDHTVFSG